MDEAALLYQSLLVGALLFCIGMVGFLSRRNMIVMFLAAEMMLQGVSVSFVAWGRYHNDWGGQIFVVFSLTVAACEAAIALALVLMLYHRNGKLDVDAWHEIRESNLPPFTDVELPEVRKPSPVWPHLAPAGVEPPTDTDTEEESQHRQHV
jgi:NADH-quinone oxidoreductase subunit K